MNIVGPFLIPPVGGGASQPPPSSNPPPTTTPPPPPPGGGCSATYKIVNSFPGGFQGEVTVKAGTSAITAWTVNWAFANGQTITQLWNGALTASGANITVGNLSYNGTLAANATTTFGFNGTWNNTTNAIPTLGCR
jgi:endoglucanase